MAIAKVGGEFARLAVRRAAAVFLCLVLAAGCASLPKQELQAIGSQVYPEKVDFSSVNTYAYRAQAAYYPAAQIRKSYPKTIRVATPGKSDVQYFIEQDDQAKVQYLVVRGTANKLNLTEDFDVKVRADRTIKIPVHTGFDQDARAVWADALPYLKKDYRTFLVGHSMGGAVAAILGIYAYEDGFKVEKIMTFGQPRFTTTAGVKQLSFLPLFRVVDENDMVPLLPPGIVVNKKLGPYDHVGPEVILLSGPDFVYLPAQDASKIAIGEFWRDLGVADIKDHHMGIYISRIAPKLKGAKEVDYNDRERYEKIYKPKLGGTNVSVPNSQ